MHRIVDFHASVKFVSILHELQNMTILILFHFIVTSLGLVFYYQGVFIVFIKNILEIKLLEIVKSCNMAAMNKTVKIILGSSGLMC